MYVGHRAIMVYTACPVILYIRNMQVVAYTHTDTGY